MFAYSKGKMCDSDDVMTCIGCNQKKGRFQTQLGLCDVCQWCIYDHITKHSRYNYKQYNYDELDSIKRQIKRDASNYSGNVLSYLKSNSTVFCKFNDAITWYMQNNGTRYLDWAKTLRKLGIYLDIETTKDFSIVC